MTDYASTFRRAVQDAILSAAEDLYNAGEIPAVPTGSFVLETPADRKNGNLSANAAMAWARELRRPPRKTAEALAAQIAASPFGKQNFEKIEAAGAGFLNFYFGQGYYAALLAEVSAAGKAWGRSDYGQGERINVEFVSANPTGPMHMGNARGGALGDCLAAILEAAGYSTAREFYVNDAGNQIEKYGMSIDARYRQIFDPAVAVPEKGYQGEDVAVRAKSYAAIHGDALLRATEEERKKTLTDYAIPLNIADMHSMMDKYRVYYDTWYHESALYASGAVDAVIALMQEKGLTYEAEGALWYKASEHGGEKDEVLVRANGIPTYFAADIAYHKNKFERGFSRCINVWGADHHGHVARMKGALDAIGLDGSKLDIILMQLVRLTRGGEVVKMSKRTGKAITLVDLLEEIPVDAVRFLFNMRAPESQMDFDLDLAVEQSAQNPVYYCQYAHARICSIFRKLAEEGVLPADWTPAAGLPYAERLTAPEEQELTAKLGTLPSEIIEAAKAYNPAAITRYCMDLAALFHKFYTACRVRCAEEALMFARLTLCAAVRDTVAGILTMFKIDVPDSM
ncbi:MAG: arginine--tRNA ligase [Oscillospiraceae bacterium]|jgi:arginyl-tRNA synthetase|nr:arginine--tRNA ligase [Oscillospiraceae bacterium]